MEPGLNLEESHKSATYFGITNSLLKCYKIFVIKTKQLHYYYYCVTNVVMNNVIQQQQQPS